MPQRSGIHRPAFAKSNEQRQRERKARLDEQRPTPWQRGYDERWRALRRQYLAQFPCCATRGCTQPASEVDHIISVRTRPDLRLAWFNLRSLCKPCHSRRTAREQGFARRNGSLTAGKEGGGPV
jgi:5-methylcytosine-specific restriction protein A